MLADLTPARGQQGPRCGVCTALDTIPEGEADALRRHMRNPGFAFEALSEALRNDPDTPLDLSTHQLSYHAAGSCRAREVLRPRQPR